MGCEDQVLDGPASEGKGSKGTPKAGPSRIRSSQSTRNPVLTWERTILRATASTFGAGAYQLTFGVGAYQLCGDGVGVDTLLPLGKRDDRPEPAPLQLEKE
jgi:hypothetical protein